MNYLFELSKDHKTLPQAEVLSCLKAEQIDYKTIDLNEDAILIESNADIRKIEIISKRLSSVFFIDNFLFSCEIIPEKIRKNAIKNEISIDGSIAVKCKNRSKNIESKKVIETLADVYTKNREVNLENPDIELRALITDSKVYVGIKLFEINRSLFESRKVQYRPFFSPITLDPKLARVLVNLSLISQGETLLDPFCGTGGILLEGGLIGARLIGSDIESKMIDGCKKTLDYYKVKNYELHCTDIGKIIRFAKNVDAVVTDFPYGKAATTKGEDMNQLYNRAFESISKVLKKKGRAILGLSNNGMISIGEEYFSLLDVYEIKAHSSLTRYFVVYER